MERRAGGDECVALNAQVIHRFAHHQTKTSFALSLLNEFMMASLCWLVAIVAMMVVVIVGHGGAVALPSPSGGFQASKMDGVYVNAFM